MRSQYRLDSHDGVRMRSDISVGAVCDKKLVGAASVACPLHSSESSGVYPGWYSHLWPSA